MDDKITKQLTDRQYDRRKTGALELEKLIRNAVVHNDWDTVRKVIDVLCNDYAYAVSAASARNGGLIGLAAVSIALNSDVAAFLDEIVPPVLSCFSDHDARVRYYAAEAMYNIAKTAKGEILRYFNGLFDAMVKLSSDAEPSVKNGAELLDRLMKDIVSDSAISYVSMVNPDEDNIEDTHNVGTSSPQIEYQAAFSLKKFMPLLQERVYALNPFTRMFLVSWITLLNSIPDLELVRYLPNFLGGLFRFLNDNNQDVLNAVQHLLDKFLTEIKHIHQVKKDAAERKKLGTSQRLTPSTRSVVEDEAQKQDEEPADTGTQQKSTDDGSQEQRRSEHESAIDDDQSTEGEEEWVPGQDIEINYSKIIEILTDNLKESNQDHIQLTALRWLDSFMELCPEHFLPFVPRLLNLVLPALSSDIEPVRAAGTRVNSALIDYIVSLPDDEDRNVSATVGNNLSVPQAKDGDRNDSRSIRTGSTQDLALSQSPSKRNSVQTDQSALDSSQDASIDYEQALNSLTLQFLNEHEATRVAALSWLLMLQTKAPKKTMAANESTFPALLKTLSDPSEPVVSRDLQLLSQIARGNDEAYFTFFMINLLKLFSTDRRLLQTRGNLILRQLCTNLSPEKIYRTMADCLEKEEDFEFNSVMVQALNDNLLTAPELFELRKKLRNGENRDAQNLFVALFRAWCHNAVATMALCLLAQAYEQAYNIVHAFTEIDMTVSMLVQMDKLIQLLESPNFNWLRLQLLEPDRYPYLYKTLYGIMMLLPQSAAFGALKNRLNAVTNSPLIYTLQYHGPSSGRAPTSGGAAPSTTTAAANSSTIARTGAGGGGVKWNELLDRFRSVQDRADRVRRGAQADTVQLGEDGDGGYRRLLADNRKPGSGQDLPGTGIKTGLATGTTGKEVQQPPPNTAHKSKFSASNFGVGRFKSSSSKSKK